MTALPARNEQVFRARHRGAIACRMSRVRDDRAPLLFITVVGRLAVKWRRPVRGTVGDAFGCAIPA